MIQNYKIYNIKQMPIKLQKDNNYLYYLTINNSFNYI